MTTYHLFTRTEYADPLQRQGTFEFDGVPGLDDLPVERSDDWLEVVLIPADEVTWVLRDGDLVTEAETPEVVA